MQDVYYALILDDEASGGLGPTALQLIRLGIDVLYAKHLDEAILLCAQPEGQRIRALLVPENVDLPSLQQLMRRLENSRQGGVPVVAVGELVDEDRCESLRKAGVEWALRVPVDESGLRWVVNAAMFNIVHDNRRRYERVPTALLGRAFMGTRRKDLLLSNLSLGGAFLETPFPFETGTRITLEIPLPERSVTVKAQVRNRQEPGEGGRRSFATGMGVAFDELSDGVAAAIRDYIAAQHRSFKV